MQSPSSGLRSCEAGLDVALRGPCRMRETSAELMHKVRVVHVSRLTDCQVAGLTAVGAAQQTADRNRTGARAGARK